MNARLIASFIFICGLAEAAHAGNLFTGERKLNNLVSELLAVSSVSKLSQPFAFSRSSDGWIFISAIARGRGTVRVILDQETVIVHDNPGSAEAMRYVAKGAHTARVECQGEITLEKLAVKSIPELIHCGL